MDLPSIQLSPQSSTILLSMALLLAFGTVIYRIRLHQKAMRRPESVTARTILASSVAVGVALFTLAASILIGVIPAIFRPPPSIEAVVWKQRHDHVQKDLGHVEAEKQEALSKLRSLEDVALHHQNTEAELKRVRNELLRAKSDLEEEQRLHAQTKGRIKGIEEALGRSSTALEVMQGRLGEIEDAERFAREQVTKFRSDYEDAKKQVQDLSSKLTAEQQHGEMLATRLTLSKRRAASLLARLRVMKHSLHAKIASLRAENNKLKLQAESHDVVEANNPCRTASIASNATLTTLRHQMDAGVGLPTVRISRRADTELVEGHVGSYYDVTLMWQDGARNIPKPFVFERGKHILAGGEVGFLAAMKTFLEVAVAPINGHLEYVIFSRGDADDERFKEPPAAEKFKGFDHIKFLPEVPQAPKQYRNPENSSEQVLQNVVSNDQLPNIRGEAIARHLKNEIRELEGPRCGKVFVLGATPKGRKRAVSPGVVLFVNWLDAR